MTYVNVNRLYVAARGVELKIKDEDIFDGQVKWLKQFLIMLYINAEN